MLTYTDIKNAHFRNIGKAGQTSDTTLGNDFDYSLGNRYQLILANLSSYINETQRTDTTVASTQYYDYPPGIVGLDGMYITIGSMKYTLSPIYDIALWSQLNALTIQPTAIPQFYFPRKSDYGIWPIPSDAWTITYNTFDRDRNLSVADYTTGTISLTQSSATVTGSGTTFTSAMVGRWLTVTDTTVPGQGYWFKITGYTSATSITLDYVWPNATASGATYRIGEVPQIPDEAHVLLPAGTAADYYAGIRNDIQKATWWNNVFWTGDGNNNSRDIGNEQIRAGLIGMIQNYQNRDKKTLIYKQRSPMSPYWKVFATTLSSS